jgi:hypothetical protein
VRPVTFRHSGAVWVGALIAVFGSLPVAATRWYLAWLPLVPLAVLAWGLRSGTRADATGLTVRALLGSRRVPWARVVAVGSPDGRRVLARLDNDRLLRLTAVTPGDLPRLVAASGRDLARPAHAVPAEPQGADGDTDPAQ